MKLILSTVGFALAACFLTVRGDDENAEVREF